MKPLELEMCGFGTYCRKTVIDFRKFGGCSLYLIAGDTGAGKTTIFDAITYALYGQASGENRDESMLRSTFANDNTETYVRLTFSLKDAIYTIKRNPAYMRRSKRGNGVTEQTADAVLTFPDGKVVTGKKKVCDEVSSLLGIDHNQFTQIVMIAQGDFMKLLTADTENRQKIFRKLFKTDYYNRLQDSISQDANELKKEYDIYRSSIRQYIDGIRCEEGCSAEVQNRFQTIKDAQIPLSDSLLKDVLMLIQMQESALKQVQDELVCNQRELDSLNLMIEQSMQLESAEKALNDIETEIEQKTCLLCECENQRSKERSRERERTEKETEIAVIQKDIPLYDELDHRQKEIRNKEQAIPQAKDLVKALDAAIEDDRKLIDTLKAELLERGSAGEHLQKCKSEQESVTRRGSALAQLQSELKAYDELCLCMETDKASLLQVENDFVRKSAEYASLFQAFLNEQAGILAEKLAVNVPCPVCGSLEHPLPAQKSAAAPTEADLDRVKKCMDDMQKKAVLHKDNLAEKKGKADSVRKTIEEKCDQLGVPASEQAIDKEVRDLRNVYAELAKTISQEEKSVKRKIELEQLIPCKENDLRNQESKRNEMHTRLEKELTVLDEQKKSLETFASKLLSSRKDAEDRMHFLQDELSRMKMALEHAERQYESISAQIQGLKGKAQAVRSQMENVYRSMKDDACVSTDFLNEKLSALKTQRQQMQARYDNIHVCLETNRNSYTHMQNAFEKQVLTEKKYGWLSELSNTVNGRIREKDRIDLETYIQMSFFDRILRRANLRFMVMSSGQFEFVRRHVSFDNRSKSGLELDVKDHYDGSCRSVKSLSGGESFEASLSLALGLSDEIQSSAGGIQLDCMFVDEGFGTLSEEPLSKTIDALLSLTEGNKLVGIISHVESLTERIYNKIIVTKERYGGSSVDMKLL